MFNCYFELEARNDEDIGLQENGGVIWSHHWLLNAFHGAVSDRSSRRVDVEWYYELFGTYDTQACSGINDWWLGYNGPVPAQFIPLPPALCFPHNARASKIMEINQAYERFSRLPALSNRRRLLALRR